MYINTCIWLLFVSIPPLISLSQTDVRDIQVEGVTVESQHSDGAAGGDGCHGAGGTESGT